MLKATAKRAAERIDNEIEANTGGFQNYMDIAQIIEAEFREKLTEYVKNNTKYVEAGAVLCAVKFRDDLLGEEG